MASSKGPGAPQLLLACSFACFAACGSEQSAPLSSGAAGSAPGGSAGSAARGGEASSVAGASTSAGNAGQITDGGSGAGGSGGGTGGGVAAGAAGTAGSGGVGTAGASGAGGGGGVPMANCPATAQVCLDFENGFPGWTKDEEPGSTISIDATFALHGTHSLSVLAPPQKRGGFIENHGPPLFPLPAGKLWGRMMIYFDGVPDGHTDCARGAGPAGELPTYNVGEQFGSLLMNYYNGSKATDCWARPKPNKKVPDKTWMCWEWSFDSMNSRLEYWMDGDLLVTVTEKGDGCVEGAASWLVPQPFESIRVGEKLAQLRDAESRVWIDDVAISNVERVGCPAP